MTDEQQHVLAALYQELNGSLRLYFRSRHSSDSTAEDLVQETFRQASKRPLPSGSSFSPRAYLFGIARNVSRQTYRKERLHRLFLKAFRRESPPLTDAPSGEGSSEALRHAITLMPPKLREILELRLQQELNYAEIAQILQIPIGTVRSRVHHAIQHLRKALPPLLSNPEPPPHRPDEPR